MSTLPGVMGTSPAMQEVARITRQVAPSRACVLLLGETGTGKELIARALHDLGPRRSGPYIRVNCGALSESLLESELFGHVKGSFTGATDNRTGRFEAAHTGSLFLDEINSTSPKLQVKLLRVLQEGEFERVGDIRTVKVDTRVIAATNRDLREEVGAERFREDLFYRLNVVPIMLPALRERREDIPLLMDYFLKRYATLNLRPVPSIGSEVMRLLVEYDWPGNVRELQNFAERAVILASEGEMSIADLPPEIRAESVPLNFARWPSVGSEATRSHADAPTTERTRHFVSPGMSLDHKAQSHRSFDQMVAELVRVGVGLAPLGCSDLYERIVGQVENELIRHVMQLCDNVQIKAAARLGINRNTLHKKIQEMRLEQTGADASLDEFDLPAE